MTKPHKAATEWGFCQSVSRSYVMGEIDFKTCKACGKTKLKSDFHKCASRKDGLQTQCKECHKLCRQSWYSKNADRHKTLRDKWYAENREARKAAVAAWVKTDQAKRPEYYRKNQANRRAAILNATVPFTDARKIGLIYNDAKILEELDGVQRSVDHIVPLRGKLVSGLHVHWNLQILTLSENASKSNKFTPV